MSQPTTQKSDWGHLPNSDLIEEILISAEQYPWLWDRRTQYIAESMPLWQRCYWPLIEELDRESNRGSDNAWVALNEDIESRKAQVEYRVDQRSKTGLQGVIRRGMGLPPMAVSGAVAALVRWPDARRTMAMPSDKLNVAAQLGMPEAVLLWPALAHNHP